MNVGANTSDEIKRAMMKRVRDVPIRDLAVDAGTVKSFQSNLV